MGDTPPLCCGDATTLLILSPKNPALSVSNCAIELSRAGLVAMLLVGLVDFIFDRSYPDSPALHLIRAASWA
jgi:hypothetical protein